RDDAQAGEALINLRQDLNGSSTALGGTDALGRDFLFDLQPRPSNTAGDSLDGSIQVIRPGAVIGNPADVPQPDQEPANPRVPSSLRVSTDQPVSASWLTEVAAGVMPMLPGFPAIVTTAPMSFGPTGESLGVQMSVTPGSPAASQRLIIESGEA